MDCIDLNKNDKMIRKCFIYRIISPSGRIYIGQTVNVNARKSAYRNLRCKSQHILYNSLKKYGFENHVFDVIDECGEIEANNLEGFYIKEYKSCIYDNERYGMNLVRQHEPERNSKRGKRNPLSESTKEKIKNSLTGVKHTLERKNNMSKACIGRIQSNETIEKRVKHLYKPIIQLSMDNIFIKEWESIKQAVEELNVPRSSVQMTAKGKYKHGGGFKWQYKLVSELTIN